MEVTAPGQQIVLHILYPHETIIITIITERLLYSVVQRKLDRWITKCAVEQRILWFLKDFMLHKA